MNHQQQRTFEERRPSQEGRYNQIIQQ
jgi:hypothetical protein